uniref:Quiannulatene synthase n=1 Tax=Emericella variicolor TaxID=1549217 RepID=QNN1_EMEVA|nr:RecName: Full=Quiannulatene synthase; Short=QS; AltName: Full=Bifunctional sesterterpene synthase EvQS; AltName: Full=Quiannulatic acid biosynthesis cluster protein EvQS; Includes: RecName: Full=Sesterterpenoid synthase; AltName: Full=Geranylgeranyl diphosphate synthase; Short=GGDP synthase; Short=GGS [Aspergillus stellatus]BAX76657.1 quiannulatene synthase [Aspergillus stellatus]
MASEVIVISDHARKEAGTVSVFPVLIHTDYARVIEDVRKVEDQFNSEMKTSIDTKTTADFPELGLAHVTAFTIPYCRPDRLSIMTRLTEITFFNDDYYDDAGVEKILDYNNHLRECFGGRAEDELTKASAVTKSKQLQASVLVEMHYIDSELARDMMLTYNRILEVTSLGKNAGLKSLDEYLPFRIGNSGIEVYQDMSCFGMGVKLTKEEKEKLDPIVIAAHNSTTLINDYHSWPKEVRKYFNEVQATGKADLPVNAVCIFMQTEGLSEQASRQRVREEIIAQQKSHLAMIQDLVEQEGPLPEKYYMYFKAAQYTASGSEYWAAITSRYPTKTELNQPEVIIVDGELKYESSEIQQTPKQIATTFNGIPESAKSIIESKVNGTSAHIPDIRHSPADGAQTHHLISDGQFREVINGHANVHTNGKANGTSQGEDLEVYEVTTGNFQRAPEDTVLAPYQYIASLPSKNIRNKFIDALNLWLGVPPLALSSIKRIVEYLHHSSLMLDDIEDNSTLRRGKPCTHMLYGNAQTINAANYAFVSAFAEVQNLQSPSAITIFIREVQNMHRGQSLDLSWKYHTHCPTVDEYMMMVDNKTGAMFRLCVQLMQAESSVPCQKITQSDFITQLGRYFQIRDDYQNLVSSEYTTQKGFCEDLDEGKISLPLIYTIMDSSPEASVVKGIFHHRLREGGLPLHLKEYILSQMEEKGALSATHSLLQKMQKELIEGLHRVEETFGSKNALVELMLRRLWV